MVTEAMRTTGWACSRCGRTFGEAYATCTDCADSQLCKDCFDDGDRYCDECRVGEVVRVADAHRRSACDGRSVEAARRGVSWTGMNRSGNEARASHDRWLEHEETIPMLSPRFDDALGYASRLHRGQMRKGTSIPYVAHLLGVASNALEYGATEDVAVAALLHDALEDQSRNGATELEIRHQFGDRVLEIVRGCTDAEGEAGKEKPPWRKRKEAYIDHIGTADASTRLVSASDKLHNARAILADLRTHGDDLWPRFTGGKEGSLWYYRALVTAFGKAGGSEAMGRLVAELDRTVTEIERVTRAAAQ